MEKVLFFIAAVLLALIIGAHVLVAKLNAADRRHCEARGGVLLELRQGTVCIKKDFLLN